MSKKTGLTFFALLFLAFDPIVLGQFNSSIPRSSIVPLGKKSGARVVAQYWLITEYVNFGEADEICRTAGFSLLSIESAQEQSTVVSEIESQGLGGRFYWTSGNDIANEGQFVWKSTGKKFFYSNFYQDPNAGSGCEPSDEPAKDCVSINGDTTYRYKWAANPCSDQKWFICEI